jgi:hypothetical protein
MSNGALRLLAGAGAVDDPVYVDDVFSTYVYTGVYSNTDIVNGIDLAGEGGLVWTKKRNSTRAHDLSDTARGVTKSLYSSAADAEGTDSQGLLAFNSNGYRIGGSSSYNNTNDEYVSWTFRKAEKFFDIVTYSGNATNGRAINHNLGSVPGMILIKSVTSSTYWPVFHRSIGKGHYLFLNTTDTKSTYESGSSNSRYWNDTDPTATQFTVSNDGWVNGSGQDYVAYLFAHNEAEYGQNSDEAIIHCGTYTGTASAGLNVDLGFEPQWVMIKRADASDDWVMYDVMRGMPVGGDSAELNPNASYAENGYFGSSQPDINPNATGFTLQGTSSPYNNSGSTYIYMAIRRPHKPASEFAATDLFSQSMGLNASAGGKVYATTYPVDFHFAKNNINGTGDWYVRDRLRGGSNYLNFNDPRAESSHSYNNEFDHMDGLYTTTGLDNTSSIGYEFRRAPGFMDVVGYKGTGSAPLVVNHNLGVTPELMIFKDRGVGSYTGTSNWWVWHPYLGTNEALKLNSSDADASNGTVFNNYSPSSTTFTVWTETGVGANGSNHIAYLFATVAGISKVSKYTGTGSDINVDCGFSAGARFVLIKRIDATGDWYVYDSVRGIVAGNDPYLFVNSNAAGVTTTDYIDPLSSGFTITSSAPAALNASSGEYLFLAIA